MARSGVDGLTCEISVEPHTTLELSPDSAQFTTSLHKYVRQLAISLAWSQASDLFLPRAYFSGSILAVSWQNLTRIAKAGGFNAWVLFLGPFNVGPSRPFVVILKLSDHTPYRISQYYDEIGGKKAKEMSCRALKSFSRSHGVQNL